MKRSIVAVTAAALIPMTGYTETPASRYFYSGDGNIHLAGVKGGASFKGRYRKGDGTYDEAAIRRIHRVFQASYGDPIAAISPRFIEFLDFLQDKFNPGARITIHSGFRSPRYNTMLRENGKLAAKASLHQYGMAADLKIAGVPSERVWNFVRELGFGGAGYYHGAQVHIDVGPARFWDEATSGVGTDISEENKLVTIVTDRDIYLPGDTAEMRFIRMTAFPIGVSPQFTLERKGAGGEWMQVQAFAPAFRSMKEGTCLKFFDIGEMLAIRWALPKEIEAGRYRVRASFCEKQWEPMPAEIATPEFEIQ